jgi:hypothetical protein
MNLWKKLSGGGSKPKPSAAEVARLTRDLVDELGYCSSERVMALIDAGADVNGKNWKGETALGIAIKRGNLDCVKALLDGGADVNVGGGGSETALTMAAEKGDPGCVKALIAGGADVNARNFSGKTVLMIVAEKGNLDCVKALLDGGADVDAQRRDTSFPDTALIYAAREGHAGCVKALIAAGADLEVRGYYDETALMKAAENGKTDCVRVLVAAGADVNAENSRGQTALRLGRGNRAISAILKAASPAASDAPRATTKASQSKRLPRTPKQPDLAAPDERTSNMRPVDLTILARSTTKRSTVTISGASKWREVEIVGWRYNVSPGPPGVVLLKPSSPSDPLSTPGFELPDDAVGGFGLEILVDEPVWVSGNDDRLVIVAPEQGPIRAITIHCIAGSKAALAKSFKVVPAR